MATLINSISLGMRQSVLYRIPRTINMTPLLRHVRAASSSLPFCLFCAHTVSGAIVLVDRRALRSAERKKLSELMSEIWREIEATRREVKSEIANMVEKIAPRLEGISARLQRMESEMKPYTVVERFWCMEEGSEGGMRYPVRP